MKRFLTLLIILCGLSAVYGDVTDDEIEAYILRQSNTEFKEYTKSRGTVDAPEWDDAISSAFSKLIKNSGESSFNAVYAIINDSSFNAGCLPGGQFFINKGALDFFDGIIKQQLSSKKGSSASELREALIAPVIAHELGHYYNKHQFKTLIKLMELVSSSPEKVAYGNIRYSIANEYEADYTGYILLQKAGYDPDLMLVTLEILNVINQESMKGGDVNANQYFLDHPSPHKRLAKFKSSRQEYHQLAAELEKAFDDVQMGINLKRAIDFLERAERKFPGNIYICKEIAVARHKLWLTTVSISDQKLKGILHTPSFRDEMVFKSDRGQSKGAEVPGNKKYYEEAYDAYMKIYKKAADPAFYSNLALLLAYSPDKVKRRKAFKLSYHAAKETGRWDLASNYSVVLYLSGERQQALEIMAAVALKYDKGYQITITKSSKDPDVLQYLQNLRNNIAIAADLNNSYVIDEFTPLLNLSLMLKYSGDRKYSKLAAEKYLSYYENNSNWAKYLSSVTRVTVREVKRKYLSVGGIKVNDTIKTLLDKWGKSDYKIGDVPGSEMWYYKGKQVKVYMENGSISRIKLDSKKSIKTENGIGVGLSRKSIEKILGRHSSVQGGYHLYNGEQVFAVSYFRNKAKVIMLLP